MAAEHGIAPERAFTAWPDLLDGSHGAEAIVVASPDREHAAPAIGALKRGLDVILEKPIASTADAVRAVAAAEARSAGRVTVAHVLRHTSFFMLLKRLLDEGRIGEMVTITHAEHIGYWHFAHSFVRGSWRSEAGSSPMILAKACHDLDLLRWLAGTDAPPSPPSVGSTSFARSRRRQARSTDAGMANDVVRPRRAARTTRCASMSSVPPA